MRLIRPAWLPGCVGVLLLSSLCFSAVPQSNRVSRAAGFFATNLLASFRVQRGFRLEVVAAEPLVSSPVAIAFDEAGKMFVAEIPDSGQPGSVARRSGSIRRLEDPDEEGQYRTSVLLAENIPWPSALACYAGGVFVASTPNVLFIKDTTGDGVADVRRMVFSGFGGTNAPSSGELLNNFNWGPNNRIHAASGGLSGLITSSNWVGQPLLVDHTDFSFDPRTFATFVETGPGLSGLTFDNHARKYVCDPGRPLRLAMYELRYYWRNPYFPRAPGFVDAASPATTVFTLPTELSVSSESRTNFLAADWLTNAQGVVVYRGNAYPPGYAENAFVCDPELHVVHRLVLSESGLEMIAARAANERSSEFLLSRDPSFRPVQAVNGPDGTLYIVDAQDRRDRGRIYRVVPEKFANPKSPQLGNAKTYDLVAGLANPNGWYRDTAARLLFQKQDSAAVPLLGTMLTNSPVPVAKIGALAALVSLGGLTEGHVLRALIDTNALVRQQGLVASEALLAKGYVPQLIGSHFGRMAGDASLPVRYQLAFTAGLAKRPDRFQLLANLLIRDPANPWLQTAVLCSLDEGAGALFRFLGSEPQFRNDPAGALFLQRLAMMIGTRGHLDEVGQAIEFCSRPALETALAYKLVYTLGEGLRRTRSSLGLVDRQNALARVYGIALVQAVDLTVLETLRLDAIRALSVSPFTFNDTGDWLLLLVNPQGIPSLRLAAVEALGRYEDPRVLPALLDRWNTFPPLLRRNAVMALLGKSTRVPAVLTAIQKGTISPADVPAFGLNMLRTYRDPQIREFALKLFGPVPVHRPQAMEQFRPALRLNGNGAAGRNIFAARCASCHQVGGAPGDLLGPDLAVARTFRKERLLSAILEPHAAVSPEFATTVIETEENENLVGIKADVNPLTITLRQATGSAVWPRLNIRFDQTQEWSLMPDGLEQGLSIQDMADLMDYLISGGK